MKENTYKRNVYLFSTLTIIGKHSHAYEGHGTLVFTAGETHVEIENEDSRDAQKPISDSDFNRVAQFIRF